MLAKQTPGNTTLNPAAGSAHLSPSLTSFFFSPFPLLFPLLLFFKFPVHLLLPSYFLHFLLPPLFLPSPLFSLNFLLIPFCLLILPFSFLSHSLFSFHLFSLLFLFLLLLLFLMAIFLLPSFYYTYPVFLLLSLSPKLVVVLLYSFFFSFFSSFSTSGVQHVPGDPGGLHYTASGGPTGLALCPAYAAAKEDGRRPTGFRSGQSPEGARCHQVGFLPGAELCK